MSDKNRIKDLKKLFISECKSGIWKQHYTSRFINQYFSVEWDSTLKRWVIVFERESILIQEIGISKFRFWLLLRKIKSSSNNYAKLVREKKIAQVTSLFFEKNLKENREKNIEEILESRY